MQPIPIDKEKPNPRYNPDKIKYLTGEEVERLLQVVKKESIRDYAIFITSYYHGLRISEPGRLYYSQGEDSDYSEETKRIKLHRMKGGLGFTYLCHDEVVQAIRKWLVIRGKAPGALFPSRKSKLIDDKEKVNVANFLDTSKALRIGAKANQAKGISKRQLDTLFKYYAHKAKLPKDKWHFHTLRHAIAVKMVEEDIPMVQIQDWLGHRSIVSTAIYAKVSDKARNETAERLYNAGKGVVSIGGRKGRGSGIDWRKDRKK